MKGWLAIIAGITLICAGLYYLGLWLEGMNFLADP